MSGSDSLTPMKPLAMAALFEATGAAIVIPNAWPLVSVIYEGQGDPAKLWKGGDGWKETIDELESTQRKIEELVRGLTEQQWKGQDRTAFNDRMHDYVNQLDYAILMAWAVAVTLWILSVVIAIFIVLMWVMATILAILATAIIVAYATVVGAPAGADLQAQANVLAGQFYSVLKTMAEYLQYFFWACAGVLTGFLAIDVAGQSLKGNKEAASNLKQATANGLDDMIKGTLQYLEQKLTAKLIKGKVDVFGKNLLKVPQGLRPIIGQRVGTKGVIDTINSSPVFTDSVPTDEYGTEDSDGDARPDGREYVDETHPHH